MEGSEIKKRRKKLGLTQPELAKKLGVSVNTIVNYENGRKIPESKISILKLVLDTPLNKQESEISSPEIKTVPLIPLYGAKSVKEDAAGMTDIGDLLRDSKCAMRIYGDSMAPNFPSGSIVGLTEVTDGVISPGDVYVIETIDNRYVKRIYEAGDGLECYSDNIRKFIDGPRKGKYQYETFIIPKESVVKMYRVVGLINRSQNGLPLK